MRYLAGQPITGPSGGVRKSKLSRMRSALSGRPSHWRKQRSI